MAIRIEIIGKGGISHWLCKCDCGNEKVVRIMSLRNKATKSCGCIHKELLIKRNTSHGDNNTRLHNIWKCMKSRCLNKNNKNFHYWGERGISICENWVNDFLKFKDWALNNGYNENLTIDRINNDKDYEPNNCRWSTMKEQANNRRNSIKKLGVI